MYFLDVFVLRLRNKNAKSYKIIDNVLREWIQNNEQQNSELTKQRTQNSETTKQRNYKRAKNKMTIITKERTLQKGESL